MTRLLLIITVSWLFATPVAIAGTTAPDDLRDPYLGEARFYAFQQDWFEAIARLDNELSQHHQLDQPELDSLYAYLGLAEFSVGDFELAYRMHQRAGRAISAVINGAVPETVRNEAIYRLARLFFQKSQPLNALHALERISGEVPEEIRADLAFLQAQVLLANGRFSEAADRFAGLRDAPGMAGFADYNLAIAWLLDGRTEDGLKQLDLAGQRQVDNVLAQGVRDKTNLVLGDRLLERGDVVAAKGVLDRVRLNGPFSSQALLGSGWTDATREDYVRALVPWSLLLEREVTDPAVQEGLLAVPYAYGKLGIHGRAALLYGQALEAFSKESDKLGASIASIREGKFLQAVVRAELQQDANWLIRLRELPDAPETYYLLDLMATHDFQDALRNYLDLDQLHRKLLNWKRELDSYEDLVIARRDYYEPLLPGIDARFRELDAQMRLRLEQRDHIERRLQGMLVAPRPDFLASARERIIAERLAWLEGQLAGQGGEEMERNRARISRLQGLLTWALRTDYDRRLTEAHRNLYDLNRDIELLQQRYAAFVRIRQAATQSYQGFDAAIRRERVRIAAATERVTALMARQGRLIEEMAVNELVRRRDRLEEYQVKARFAMADSYDRAARAQGKEKREE